MPNKTIFYNPGGNAGIKVVVVKITHVIIIMQIQRVFTVMLNGYLLS